jgi:hypothetical protein
MSTACAVVAACPAEETEVAEEDLEAEVGSVEEPEAAVRRSAALHISGGTCHVARCHAMMATATIITMAVFLGRRHGR